MSRTAKWTVRLSAPQESPVLGSMRKRSTNYHEYDRRRQKQRRDALRKDDSEAAKVKKEMEREAARIRQQRRRQKLKEQGASSQGKKQVLQAKKADPGSRKAYFREYRRKWRASISVEKQQTIKEKEREKYRKKRQNRNREMREETEVCLDKVESGLALENDAESEYGKEVSESKDQDQRRDLDAIFLKQSLHENTETHPEYEVYRVIHVKEETPESAFLDEMEWRKLEESHQNRKPDATYEEQRVDENTETQRCENQVCHIHIKEESPDLAFPISIVESDHRTHKAKEQKQGRDSEESHPRHVQVKQMVSKLVKHQKKKYLEQVLCIQRDRQNL
ncbi:trichohyalin-like [Lytechinus variegatus]|uniref:trichohyalin-like n=1 Tax=Lytechinus variegatus TaxID=7654 RepID=UPI001BB1E23D|nr:trichohyalin-like [Lytechinus variegatus]